MTRVFAELLLYGSFVCATFGAGCWMLLAPAHASNTLRDAFVIFPASGPQDADKRLLVRLVGVALLGYAGWFCFGLLQAGSLYLPTSAAALRGEGGPRRCVGIRLLGSDYWLHILNET